MNLEWRKRQIVMEPELVNRVADWHGGQFSAAYALASTGASDLVSLSMIDAAIDELSMLGNQLRRKKGSLRDGNSILRLVGDLEALRRFWRESSAKEAGMGLEEDEYEYDETEYDYDEDDINTTSG